MRPTRRSFGLDKGVGLAEASGIDVSIRSEAAGQPEKQFAVHFGIARQTKSAEQIIGIVNRSVVSADNDSGADGMVVPAVGFTATGPPAGVAHKNSGVIINWVRLFCNTKKTLK